MEKILEKIFSLAKRRGFVFPSSEIYGGISGFFDYGPLGVEMKENIKRLWWKFMVQERENVVGIDSAIIQNPKVWQASGHVERFFDFLTECKNCHKRFRADHLVEGEIKDLKEAIKKIKCPDCGGQLTEPREFNLMFKITVGPVEESGSVSYLRPETAQGIFVNFKNVLQTQRMKVPFGIAQMGKAFRNEVTPRNFLFRTREFEQMELEFFVEPGTDDYWFDFWIKERMKWYTEILGLKKENLRVREHKKEELAHYAKRCVDIEYKFPFGWGEIEGIANRTDFDLKQHQKFSGENLTYFDGKKTYIPYVIEPSAGVDRIFLALLCDSYQEIKGGRTKTTKPTKEVEILLKLDKKVSPIKVAILPLVKNKLELVKKAKEIYQMLKPHFVCQYDELGSIGRRYRRQDEIATVVAVTVDFQTLKDETVTCRDRDTMAQIRVKIPELRKVIQKILEGEEFLKLGKPI